MCHYRATRIQNFFLSANHGGRQYFSAYHGPFTLKSISPALKWAMCVLDQQKNYLTNHISQQYWIFLRKLYPIPLGISSNPSEILISSFLLSTPVILQLCIFKTKEINLHRIFVAFQEFYENVLQDVFYKTTKDNVQFF